MPESLEQLLAHLKAEIEKSEHGAGDRETLARLAGEVEQRLGNAGDDQHDDKHDDKHEGLVEELRDGVRRFEVTHPQLAQAIGHVADALGGIGL